MLYVERVLSPTTGECLAEVEPIPVSVLVKNTCRTDTFCGFPLGSSSAIASRLKFWKRKSAIEKTPYRRFRIRVPLCFIRTLEAPPPEPKISRRNLLFFLSIMITGSGDGILTPPLQPQACGRLSRDDTHGVPLAWNAYSIAVEVHPRGGRSNTISKELADERARKRRSHEEKEHSS